ncbi:amino acid racemase [Flagellimonas hymeniacidonis]|uniref:Amino acid racemase n=1 Tax=Flagellimonas hymeniacidonis TaxID=2603628 RepID=A0A5C8V3H8_9FLAO|nr:amino acid racemase [Flagellimonas hymeniacidonis]TXN36114.1 amino acid racemase [Flagellimonas hymeniacidonis]
MKKIGLVGGISWTSTLDYYKGINEGINRKLGGLDAAECVIYSLNFGDIQRKTWVNSFDLILNACKTVESIGVDAIVLCANTAHLFADTIQREIDIPIIHIVKAAASEIQKSGLQKVGLLGTQFTMEMNFYHDKLNEYDIQILIPESQEEIAEIQHIIKNELGKGIITSESKKKFIQYAEKLISRGAEGIMLGCTEIPMLIEQKDFNFPVFDTTKIHVEHIVNFALDTENPAVNTI